MKNFIWFLSVAALGCAGIDSPSEAAVSCSDRLTEITGLEALLFGAGEAGVDPGVRDKLLKGYAEFSNSCSGDPATPEMLFRRADLLRSKGAFEEAMTQLRDVHDHFPQFEKRARCAFIVGFIAETELGDAEQARLTYQQVIDVHPNSIEAQWAQLSLSQLDMKDANLMQVFQK
jgi:tetratricopeptide (TPR) repeat protein